MSGKPKLGYIGLGLMGRPMVLRLLAAGYAVAVWNRSRDKLAPVVEKGAKGMSSPAEVARAAARYRLLHTQGKAEKDPAVLIELLSGNV